MTMQEQIIQDRTARGLKIVILREDGSEFTCYPKDCATKEQWLATYRAKGITICAS